ncbi:hypothetical protein [Marinoscillum sp. MHG1-6]|uniref:HYC_CC_PP family protein n=1 Tax=Marinoscillum sp. MHG1-6 TaxID=2959627 RepID=UPI002157D333|nr:hypothetical protein [Marinoscillum sp. MHG1-6]
MKKLISISLALIFLLGTLGISHGTHFCGGHAVISELMIGQKHLDCGMGMMEMPEHNDDGQHLSTPPCCENHYVSIDTGDFFKKQQAQDLTPALVAVTVARILYVFEYVSQEDSPVFIDTSPPFLSQNLNKLHEVYLI